MHKKKIYIRFLVLLLLIGSMIYIQISIFNKQSESVDINYRLGSNNTLDYVTHNLERNDMFIGYVTGVSSEHLIDTNAFFGDIVNMVKRELVNNNVFLDFELAIQSVYSGVVFQTENFDELTRKDRFIVSFTLDDVSYDTFFVVLYFTQSKFSQNTSTYVLLLISIIIVVLIIYIALYIILFYQNQKNDAMIKNDFLNNITHELKTPITTISLASQMIADDTVKKEQKDIESLSSVIHNESVRLMGFVDKILDMSQFDIAEMSMDFTRQDVHSILDGLVDKFQIRMLNVNGSFVKEYNAINHYVMVDKMHFTNAISNLIDNAIKYSNKEPHIILGTFNDQDKICIFVSDNGIGISKKDTKKIFDRFFRVHTGNLHKVKGLGLGLSYTKTIIDKHKGTIKVESEPNKGSKFYIFVSTI